MLRKIKQFKPDLIHAHYGLSGFLANMQFCVPVVTTFHGSDINDPNILKWSKWTHKLSAASIFVENSMMQKFRKHHKSIVIPCGVDISVFHSIPKLESQNFLKLNHEGINVLFSSDFNNPVKNYRLATMSCTVVEQKTNKKINLIECKGYSRKQVNLLINASDFVLLYSISEGSPQIIKEAMACNCPIVATNVGDVNWIIGETKGCFLTSFSVDDVADKIIKAIEFSVKFGCTNGRERILNLGLNTENIANRISEVYNKSILPGKSKLTT